MSDEKPDKKMPLYVDFGWFEYLHDMAYFKESTVCLPASHYRIDRPVNANGHTWEYEAVFPLENRLSAWLFAQKNKYWTVSMSLYVPCPLHDTGKVDPYRCEMWAQWTDSGHTAVKNATDCAGPSCQDCYHDTDCVMADPGDADEFFEVLKHWGGLNFEPDPSVGPHDENLLYMKHLRSLHWHRRLQAGEEA